jgi:hypothetical protein
VYLVYKVSVPRLYPITLKYDLESVLFQRLMYLMYLMYTLDMLYILNFAIVLWIYGKLNEIKRKYGTAGQATDSNMAHAYCMLDN